MLPGVIARAPAPPAAVPGEPFPPHDVAPIPQPVPVAVGEQLPAGTPGSASRAAPAAPPLNRIQASYAVSISPAYQRRLDSHTHDNIDKIRAEEAAEQAKEQHHEKKTICVHWWNVVSPARGRDRSIAEIRRRTMSRQKFGVSRRSNGHSSIQRTRPTWCASLEPIAKSSSITTGRLANGFMPHPLRPALRLTMLVTSFSVRKVSSAVWICRRAVFAIMRCLCM